MPVSLTKYFSLALVITATVLFCVNAIDFIWVFKTETGLLDFIPAWARYAMHVLYAVSLLGAYFFYTLSRHIKSLYDTLIIWLLFANGVGIFSVIYYLFF